MANINGWSDFSDESYIFAFSSPERPPAPTFVSADSTSVTLGFLPSRNDFGIRVVGYELYIDEGDNTLSQFRKLSSYSVFKKLHTLTVVNDGLGALKTLYRVKLRAVNERGMYSEFSNELLFYFAPLPSQVASIRKNPLKSSSDSIAVEWDIIKFDTIPVLGYKLYANTGRNEPLRLVYESEAQISEFLYDSNANGERIDYQLVYRF